MDNYDFALRGMVKVLKPQRDEDDKVVRDPDTKAIVKEEHEVPGVVRGRVVASADMLVIINETGEEVGRVVVTDGVLDLVEGEADPDKRVRMTIAGGLPEPGTPAAGVPAEQFLAKQAAEANAAQE